MRSVLRVSLGVLTLFAIAQGLAAQARSVPRGVMDGIVTDTSLVPIASATITLFGSSIGTKTGENGRFRIIALPAGEYVVIARRLGYASASVALHLEAGDTLRPSFTLRRATPELDTVRSSAVVAAARLGEFEERRAQQVGHFITADEIYKRNPLNIADMMRTVLSVRISEKGAMRLASSMRTPGGCPFQIFVDGTLFSEGGDLTNVPTPGEIHGVEIYSGPATIPLQYKRSGTRCGVILIWTKSGQ
jgi:Carboxypeptidase regulatory-like domain